MTGDPYFKATPLGGLGRVGGNLMAYETSEHLIAVDCGVLFPSADQPGVDYVIPDVSYLLARRDKLRAFVLTHGHEDHIGALPYVLPELNVPVYGTALAVGLARSRIEEAGITPDLRAVETGTWVEHGPFRFRLIPVIEPSGTNTR